MADWGKARLGNIERRGDEWIATVIVPVDGPDDDPREGLPKPAAKPRPVSERRVPRYGRGGGEQD